MIPKIGHIIIVKQRMAEPERSYPKVVKVLDLTETSIEIESLTDSNREWISTPIDYNPLGVAL